MFPYVSDGSVDYKQFLDHFSVIDTEEVGNTDFTDYVE